MKGHSRIGNERDYCGQLTGEGIRKDLCHCLGWPWCAWTERLSTTLSTRFLCRHKKQHVVRKKSPSHTIGKLHSLSFLFFFYTFHVRSKLHTSTSKQTPLPELWPLRRHIYQRKQRKRMKDKINNSRRSGRCLTRGPRITIEVVRSGIMR